MKIKPCPYCNDAWMYVSDGDYYSDYESYGYKVECRCGYAWKHNDWCDTEEEAIRKWNLKVRRIKKEEQK